MSIGRAKTAGTFGDDELRGEGLEPRRAEQLRSEMGSTAGGDHEADIALSEQYARSQVDLQIAPEMPGERERRGKDSLDDH